MLEKRRLRISPGEEPTASPREEPTARGISTASPREEPTVREILTVSPREEPTVREILTASPREEPTVREILTASPREEPTVREILTASPREEPTVREILTASPREEPTVREILTVSPREEPTVREILMASPREELTASRKRAVRAGEYFKDLWGTIVNAYKKPAGTLSNLAVSGKASVSLGICAIQVLLFSFIFLFLGVKINSLVSFSGYKIVSTPLFFFIAILAGAAILAVWAAFAMVFARTMAKKEMTYTQGLGVAAAKAIAQMPLRR